MENTKVTAPKNKIEQKVHAKIVRNKDFIICEGVDQAGIIKSLTLIHCWLTGLRVEA